MHKIPSLMLDRLPPTTSLSSSLSGWKFVDNLSRKRTFELKCIRIGLDLWCLQLRINLCETSLSPHIHCCCCTQIRKVIFQAHPQDTLSVRLHIHIARDIARFHLNPLGIMPSNRKGATKHHCPKKNGREGPCNETWPEGAEQSYCKRHQIHCSTPGCNNIHLKTEECRTCKVGGKHRDQRIAEEQAVEDKKAAKQREKDELMGRDPNAPKNKKRK